MPSTGGIYFMSFYHNPLFPERLLTIFVKGDRPVIYPFCLLLVLIYFFDPSFTIILGLTFLSLRFAFETIYWFLQQFVGGTYRPFDYGFKSLSNNSIYIVYQLTSTVFSAIFISLLVKYILSYVN